jgi:DNA modification methylase
MYKKEEIINRIFQGDSLEELKKFPDECIDLCITSPPYYNLRDYQTSIWEDGDVNCNHLEHNDLRDDVKQITSKGTIKIGYKKICKKCGAKRIDKQIGLEETPEEYIEKLVLIFREVKRILKSHGTLWLNIGDCYNGSGKGGDSERMYSQRHTQFGKLCDIRVQGKPTKICGLKPKDLIEIPSMLAIALRNDGWYLRSRIPWVKRNSMPESCIDRPSSAIEYVFLLSKNEHYYYDIESIKKETVTFDNSHRNRDITKLNNTPGRTKMNGLKTNNYNRRNRRNSDWFFDSWEGLYDNDEGNPLALVVNPKGYKEAHFATFPENFVLPMILAGSSEKGICSFCGKPWIKIIEKDNLKNEREIQEYTLNVIPGRNKLSRLNSKDMKTISKKLKGWEPSCDCDKEIIPAIVLDPFSGAGTTALVALKNNRNYVGIELNSEYINISEKRIKDYLKSQKKSFFID